MTEAGPRTRSIPDRPADIWLVETRRRPGAPCRPSATVLPRCALDIEANSLHAYRERTCVIQVTAEGRHAIIDAVALEDLAPLRDALDRDDLELLLHGGDYDIAMLSRDHDFAFHRVFDTMIAATLLGRGEGRARQPRARRLRRAAGQAVPEGGLGAATARRPIRSTTSTATPPTCPGCRPTCARGWRARTWWRRRRSSSAASRAASGSSSRRIPTPGAGSRARRSSTPAAGP